MGWKDKTVYYGSDIYTMNDNGDVIKNGQFIVEKGVITSIGECVETKTDGSEYWVNLDGYVVLPGLVNAHTHAAMSLKRGAMESVSLSEWLNDFIWPAENKILCDDFVYWGTALACMEMLRSGTTTFGDMYYHEWAAADAVGHHGMRAVLGHTVMEKTPVNDGYNRPEQVIEELLQTIKENGCDRVTHTIAPHSPYACTSETVDLCRKFAKEHNLPMFIHVSESSHEWLKVPIFKNLVAVHAVRTGWGEMRLLADDGASVVACPRSNAKLGVHGICPVQDMLDHGVNVALGTDSACTSNNLDMFQEMSAAALFGKHLNGPEAMDSQEVVRMATINGAEALGLQDQIGSIEVGKKADFIVLDLDTPEAYPNYNVYDTIVHSVTGSCVEMSYVNGILMYVKNEPMAAMEMIFAEAEDFVKILKDIRHNGFSREELKNGSRI